MIEQINELKAKNQKDLRNWIEYLLRTNETESPRIISREEYPSMVLLEVYESSGDDPKFQQRVREAVTDLVFSYSHADLEYFHELVILIAELRLVDCYKELVSKARSGEFKGEKVHGMDLHYQLLRVLYSFKNYKEEEFGKDLEILIKENIRDNIYFSISFRANWERKGPENGLRTLFELLDVIDAIPESYVNFTLRNFFRRIDSDRELFFRILKQKWPTLGTKEQCRLIFLLSKTNVYILKPTSEILEGLRESKDVLVVVWNVNENFPPERWLLSLPCDDSSVDMRTALEQAYLSNMLLSSEASSENRILFNKEVRSFHG